MWPTRIHFRADHSGTHLQMSDFTEGWLSVPWNTFNIYGKILKIISLIFRVFPTISWLHAAVSLISVARSKDKWTRGGLSYVVIYMFTTSDSTAVRPWCDGQPISSQNTCLSALKHRKQEESQSEMPLGVLAETFAMCKDTESILLQGCPCGSRREEARASRFLLHHPSQHISPHLLPQEVWAETEAPCELLASLSTLTWVSSWELMNGIVVLWLMLIPDIYKLQDPEE